MKKQPTFKTRARLINQLGEQLIKNEAIALLELIKNSYDADASTCLVTMSNPQCLERGEIVVEDDGVGMSYETLSSVWLEIGTSYKVDLEGEDGDPYRSPIHKRLPLGEKGIGRLGAHRLGRKIEVVSREEGKLESVLEVDWDNIETSQYIEDLPVKVFQREPEVFLSGKGTKITIKRFRVPWTRKTARECARAITSLNSPFDSDDSFRVIFEIPKNNWLDGVLTFEEIEQYKLFLFDITMSGNELKEFSYEFCPWDTMKQLKSRRVTLDDGEMKNLTRMVYGKGLDTTDINLGKYSIGSVRFRGMIFDRDTRILNLGVQGKMGLKKYLNANGGVRVFRDNMRIFDYGELGNDWLDLGGRRVNMPTKRISNNILLGAVYVDRASSPDLMEKANREGFVENAAYWELWRAIRFAIDRIESLRKTDKDLLRKFYGAKQSSEPVITSIGELKNVVIRKVKDESVRNEINRYLDRIEGEYDAITNSLLKSAGAGLNLIIVIHQIEKIIKDIQEMLKKKASTKVLGERVKTLSALVEGYSILVKNSDKKERNLKGIVEQCIFNMEFRLEAHEILLESAFRSKVKNLDAICSEDHVLNALMNLFDNSIWWLGYSRTKVPKVFLDISDKHPGYISIVVADNGPGFTKPTSEIVEPFVSDKPGGMGIGLHLTHEIMKSLGGELLFPGMEIFEIPEEYAKGAVVALAFKKKKGGRKNATSK